MFQQVNYNTQPNELLEHALFYARKGWQVLPVHTIVGGRCSCGRSNCDSAGKHPRIKNWTKNATTDERTIRKWWGQWPTANIGIATGAGSGIICLDIDPKNNGLEELEDLENKYSKLPDTVVSITGSGGKHILFKCPGFTISNSASSIAPGVDIRGDGGQFVAEPSIHSSGRQYKWEGSSHPEDIDPVEAPAWLIGLIKKSSQHPQKTILEEGGPVPAGQRNDTLFKLAATLRRYGANELEIYTAITATNERCVPPLDDRELKAIAESAVKYPPAPVAPHLDKPPIPSPSVERFNNTDLGNAERLLHYHGGDLRFCNDWNKWLIWNEQRWKIDTTRAVEQKATHTVRQIYHEAGEAASPEDRKALATWARTSESFNRIKAMLELAKSKLPVSPDLLDRDRWLLNVENGTVNLKTGELQPHNRTNLITKLASVTYDPSAQCPTWLEFLNTIMGGNKNLIAYLQKAVGYSLTGEISEQCMFILHGSGANGKSTFLETLGAMLGPKEYAEQAPTKMLMVKNFDGVPNDIAMLKGARFVTASEAEEGQKFAESLIKQMTGGERITARFMRAEFFTFQPDFKLFLGTNHRPTIKGTDHGIWRRIRLIPFTVTIAPEQQDKDLPRKLLAELPGILAWAVRGCLLWQREGLGMPDEVKAATEGYKSEMDSVISFIETHCFVAPQVAAASSDLYDKYIKWCEKNEEEPISQKKFGMSLESKGFVKMRGSGGIRMWKGIGLLDIPKSNQKRATRTPDDIPSEW